MEVNENTYKILNCYGFEDIRSISDIDCISHLWTIQDAKDGDVLKGYGECYILFKELKDGNLISYCDFSKSKFHSWEEVDWAFQMFDPTTEYQRINFFQKMHEAGYTWDAKTKQLIKIQS